MNHDSSHCIDFQEDCPKDCFRAQLVRGLRRDPTQAPMGLVSWMSFRALSECIKGKEDGSDREGVSE